MTTKPGHARCAVPFCRRTAAEADDFEDQGFLCGAHWRLRSPATKANWREINRLIRRNPGPFWDYPPGSAGRMIRLAIERHHRALWEVTKAEVIEVAMGSQHDEALDDGTGQAEDRPSGPARRRLVSAGRLT